MPTDPTNTFGGSPTPASTTPASAAPDATSGADPLPVEEPQEVSALAAPADPAIDPLVEQYDTASDWAPEESTEPVDEPTLEYDA